MPRVFLLTVLVVGWAVPAAAKPLVDCTRPEFKRTDSARSLYLWSIHAEKNIIKARKQGVFGVKRGNVRGDAVSDDYCRRMISYRGSAHCQDPGNAEYRTALLRLIKLCEEANKPVKTTKRLGIDCKDKRFIRPEATVDLLLRWTDLSLGGLDSLQPHEDFRIKVKCDQALKHAGTAYCKAPNDPRTPAAIAKVRKRCAQVQTERAAGKTREEKATRDREVARKANRKIVKIPRSTYRDGRGGAVTAAMKRALLAGRLAKSPAEVLRVQPMGRWKSGRYTDTKLAYKKITGIVLWWDKDKDGVCRFVSYNFTKSRRGKRWSPLKVGSFCLGCPEGWTRCN